MREKLSEPLTVGIGPVVIVPAGPREGFGGRRHRRRRNRRLVRRRRRRRLVRPRREPRRRRCPRRLRRRTARTVQDVLDGERFARTGRHQLVSPIGTWIFLKILDQLLPRM